MSTPKQPVFTVQNCVFNGVHFDAPAVEAVKNLADAFRAEAEAAKARADAMGALARVFNGAGMTIGPLLQVGGTPK